jgi:2-keto-3-deoxy-L-rhamnonate aldolase RhmA
MTVTFKERLRRRDRLIGTVLTLPVPELAEICSDAGFDWLFLDMEHGLLDPSDVQRICQVVGNRCPCLTRIPINEEVWIKKVLDVGVAGLIIPLVNTPEEASRAVRQSKYPPEGNRSVGITRAHRYGVQFQEYIHSANQQTAVIIQVEHIRAVQNLEKILEVPDVDALFVGPYDLSASLGKPGQISYEEVQQAIIRVKTACAERNFPVGIFARDAETAKVALETGYTLLAVGLDCILFSTAARRLVELLR